MQFRENMVSYMYKMNDYTDYVYFVLGGMKDENEKVDRNRSGSGMYGFACRMWFFREKK